VGGRPRVNVSRRLGRGVDIEAVVVGPNPRIELLGALPFEILLLNIPIDFSCIGL
jgi:hypothetical protein